VLKQPVTLQVYGRDRYKRILGVLHQGPNNIKLWLVESGLAWVYRGGRNDAPANLRRRLEAAEQEARRAVRGLWADATPEAPWLFRRRERLGR
jgi:endonuclease YncB( thermonuclease family)